MHASRNNFIADPSLPMSEEGLDEIDRALMREAEKSLESPNSSDRQSRDGLESPSRADGELVAPSVAPSDQTPLKEEDAAVAQAGGGNEAGARPERGSSSRDPSGANSIEDSGESSSDEEESSSSASSDDDDDDDDDDSDGDDDAAGPVESDAEDEIPRTRNEVADEVVPRLPEDLVISEKTPLESIGSVKAVGERAVIVEAFNSARYRVLAEGAVLVLEDERVPIGVLYETFGPVDKPFYVVKFAEEDELAPFREKVGTKVAQVVSTAHYVRTDEFKVKGTDASNFNDEEVPLEEQEFSDDEQEMLAKAGKSKKRKKTKARREPTGQDLESRAQQPDAAPAPPPSHGSSLPASWGVAGGAAPPQGTPTYGAQSSGVPGAPPAFGTTPPGHLAPAGPPATAMMPMAMTPEMMQQWYQFQQFQQFQYQMYQGGPGASQQSPAGQPPKQQQLRPPPPPPPY